MLPVLLVCGCVTNSGAGDQEMENGMNQEISTKEDAKKLIEDIISGRVKETPTLNRRIMEFLLRGANRDIAREISQLIEENLDIGASSAEIEAFFEKHDIGYSFFELGSRYNGIIRNVAHDPDLDQAVEIYIFVDDKGNFVRSKVFDSF